MTCIVICPEIETLKKQNINTDLFEEKYEKSINYLQKINKTAPKKPQNSQSEQIKDTLGINEIEQSYKYNLRNFFDFKDFKPKKSFYYKR